ALVLAAGSLVCNAAPIRVACVGDSITFGAGLKDRHANAYPVWLGRWLGSGYDVRNFGVSGATLLHQGDRPYIKQRLYTNALAFKADVVIINLGANDSKHPNDGSLDAAKAINNWQYSSNYVSDYEALIAAFKTANPSTKFYVCFPTPDYPGRWGINDKTVREDIIPMVRTVSKDTGASIIDLYKAMSGKAELFPDTVHPNDEGAKLMAAAVYRGLKGQSPPETLGSTAAK
ncbi:MAG TPA: GDSL-type esterase/lipase family protein, partial [Candidatus Polarisedimenticolia bacterium]|nr:GDSL-type esterase/lipase family protein [Candidatus Polarisedimenticolia bacterium]